MARSVHGTYCYAAYIGDTFVDVADNINVLANNIGISTNKARWLQTPSAHSRAATDDVLLIYKYKI